MTTVRKAYVRFDGVLPATSSAFTAAEGFTKLGVEVIPFREVEEIERAPDLSPETIVCGQIRDVWAALARLGHPRPVELDYPDHLAWLAGRRVERTTLGATRELGRPVFVKPTRAKLFTGLVLSPSNTQSRITLAPYPDDLEVLVSDVVDFVSEWRCFVCRDEVVGVRPYRGAWDVPPDREALSRAVTEGRGRMPAGHSLDLGVTADGRTLLVEANDGYALGSYGLPSIPYAQLLEARWDELAGAAGR